MARVNVYLPDDLAAEAREADINISRFVQEALRRELAGRATSAWLASLETLPPNNVTHEDVLRALDETRDEAGDFAV